MAGSSRSAAALAEIGVRVIVGHVVAHGSMVTRAYLTDICSGVVVDEEGGPWLVSTRDALLPDPEDLKTRAERERQIPREYATPSLQKLTLSWGADTTAEVRNPRVVAGSGGAAAVSLSFPASLPGKLRGDGGPVFVDLVAGPSLQLGDTVGVAVVTPRGALVRWGRVASDAGFGDHEGAVAVAVALESEEAGSPVYRFDGESVSWCGLIEPLDATTAVLVPVAALAGAIEAARAIP